jgi:putative transposase
MPDISERKTCCLLRVARSALHRQPKEKSSCGRLSEELVAKLEQLMQEYPTYGYRRLWALLRFRHGQYHNRKAVYRALRLKGWLVHQRIRTPRPRVQARRSRATQSNIRWAMDVTHIPCGQDGWGHLTVVID